MTRIVVRMPNWIGDFVMATPVLEDLRARYPEATITALCSAPLGLLLEGNPFVDEVLSFSRALRFFPKSAAGSLLSILRKRRYDLGFLLTNSFSSAWLFWAGGVKKRIGFAKRSRAFLLSDNIPFPAHRETQHLVETYKALLGASNSRPRLFIPKLEKPMGKTWIGLNPGAAYGTAKCWLPERFHAVALELAEIPGSELFFFGDQTTAPLIAEICRGLPPNVHNLASKTTLRELVERMGALDAFLSNDSGPMHIAAALKTPLVALFGSTNDQATGPYQWGEVIHKRVSCSPCYQRVCPIDFRCMKQIEVTEVVQAVKRALLTLPLRQELPRFSFSGVEPVQIVPTTICTVAPKSAAIILAAGMGRRLGLPYPKGLLQVGGKTLYEILLEKGRGRPMAIMTSAATHQKTKEFLEAKGFSHVSLFQTRMLPRLTAVYEESPEGNGAIYSALYASPLWKAWQEIERISVVPIDNPLADPFDPHLLHTESELSVKAIVREEGEENLGVLFAKEGRLHICEYFQLPDRGQKGLGYSGCFAAKKTFFEKAAALPLPWHQVQRNGAFHLERFIFDAFPAATNYQIVVADRKKEFAPIKTIADLASLERMLYTTSP